MLYSCNTHPTLRQLSATPHVPMEGHAHPQDSAHVWRAGMALPATHLYVTLPVKMASVHSQDSAHVMFLGQERRAEKVYDTACTCMYLCPLS